MFAQDWSGHLIPWDSGQGYYILQRRLSPVHSPSPQRYGFVFGQLILGSQPFSLNPWIGDAEHVPFPHLYGWVTAHPLCYLQSSHLSLQVPSGHVNLFSHPILTSLH